MVKPGGMSFLRQNIRVLAQGLGFYMALCIVPCSCSAQAVRAEPESVCLLVMKSPATLFGRRKITGREWRDKRYLDQHRPNRVRRSVARGRDRGPDRERPRFTTDEPYLGVWRALAGNTKIGEAKEKNDVHWAHEEGKAALEGVRVVLVGPQSSGNVGSVCRIASNFECKDLWLVNPECDYHAEEAQYMASNPVAKTLLEEVSIAKTLRQALGECNMSVGFTRRQGRSRIIDMPFSELRVPTSGTTTGLVFGREDSGLTNEELMYCTHVCSIPSSRWEGSLNLSHAVALTLSRIYESYPHRKTEEEIDPTKYSYLTRPGTATLDEVNFLIKRWKHVLKNCNRAAALVTKPEFTTPERFLFHLRKLVYRARLSSRETNSMHGFLTLVDNNSHAVGDLVSDLQEKGSDGESEEEDYDAFVNSALAANKELEEHRGWEDFEDEDADDLVDEY